MGQSELDVIVVSKINTMYYSNLHDRIDSMFLVLHNVRSMENVGAMFRTADAMGVSKIFLVGYTPAPTDRFGRKVTRLAKAALGAEDTVPWEREADIEKLISRLKHTRCAVLSLEQDSRSIPVTKYVLSSEFKQAALIVGNEVEGVPKNVLDLSDAIIEIPMMGTKESLNVSVATGIALFQLTQGMA